MDFKSIMLSADVFDLDLGFLTVFDDEGLDLIAFVFVFLMSTLFRNTLGVAATDSCAFSAIDGAFEMRVVDGFFLSCVS